MKILHTEASCGWGGQEIRILEEARGLIGRGHELSLACPPEARIFSAAGRYGVPVVALPIGRKSLGGIIALRRHIARTRPDVINTHSSTDTWMAALARLFLAAPPPLVRTRHISAPIPRNTASRWLYTRATTHIVTTGERLRETLIRDNGYPGGMITSIPTGIDPQRFLPGDRQTARRELGKRLSAAARSSALARYTLESMLSAMQYIFELVTHARFVQGHCVFGPVPLAALRPAAAPRNAHGIIARRKSDYG